MDDLLVGTLSLVGAAFALLELWPGLGRLPFPPRLLPIGGVLSGFFGGFSDHQGALPPASSCAPTSDRDGLAGITTLVSAMVDMARLAVDAAGFGLLASRAGDVAPDDPREWRLHAAATACAFVASFLGARLVKKTTLAGCGVVGLMPLALAAALGAGVV